MRVYVCIKQVPDTDTRIKISGSGDGIDEGGVKWIINPYDEFAIEEAIRLKEKNPSAQVTAICLGPKARVNNSLLTAMAMGVDDSILIDTPTALDSLTTAKALAAAIKKNGDFHMIFTGKLGIDGNVSATSQMLAEILAIPHVSVVNAMEYSADKFTAKREIEGGGVESYESSYPALIAANKGLNKPRFASLPGIMKAKKKPVVEIPLADLGLSADNVKVRFTSLQMPPARPAVKMITGEPAQQAKELVRLLREEAKVL